VIRFTCFAALLLGTLPAYAQPHEPAEPAPTEVAATVDDVGDSGTDAQGDDALPAPALANTHEAPAAAHGEASPAGAHGEAHGEAQGEGHGAEHHAGVDAKTLALQLLNFGVLLFLLIKYAGRGLKKTFVTKHEQLAKDIGDAAKARDAAKQQAEEQERRLASLEQEIAALRAGIQQDAQKEQARLLANAQEKAKRIQADTQAQLETQVKAAEARLRAEVAIASVQLASEILKKQIGMDDDRRLAKEFIAGFEAAANAGKTVP
jgi:F-type H+-transporting ATPase subunit b